MPEHLLGVKPGEQFTAHTHRSAIEIGQALGVSPLKLEHLTRNYLGTLGVYLMGAGDAVVGDHPETGPEPASRGIVAASRFRRVGPYTRTQWEEDFYDMLDASREVVKTANHMRATLRAESAEGEILENEEVYGRARALERIKSTSDEMRRAMTAVRYNADLTADEKREQIDELQGDLNELMKETTTELAEAE